MVHHEDIIGQVFGRVIFYWILVMNYNGSISLITISGVWAWVYQFPSHNMHKSKTQKYSLDICGANEGTGEEVANVTE